MADTQRQVVFMSATQSATRASGTEKRSSAIEAGALLRLLTLQDAPGATQLTAAVQADVIPRLLLARSADARDARLPATAFGLGRTQTEGFTDLILRTDDDRADVRVKALLEDGNSIDSIYVDLLAPVARELGDLWLDDRCSFAEVTLGVSRLTRMMRDLSESFHQTGRPVGIRRNVLLLPLAGEQHTFGLLMVAEFFRRARWAVSCQSPSFTAADVAATIAMDPPDVIGLSLCHEGRLDELACLIRVIRRAARGRDIGIIVGGFPFVEHPEYVALVGADISATDARQAPRQAETLIAALSHASG